MNVRARVCLAGVTLCLVSAGAVAAVDRPVAVSPGGLDTVRPAAALCPTFSWGGVAAARGYEIVAYEMTGTESLTGPREQPATLTASVPGSALSWTPPADRCLAAATAYVWFVRAIGANGLVSEWSRGAMFRSPPAQPELEETILRIMAERCSPAKGSSAGGGSVSVAGLLRRPLVSSPGSSRPVPRAPSPADLALRVDFDAPTMAPSFAIYGISNSGFEDSAAVAGFASSESGEASGVAGFSRSPEGRGVFGENTAASGGIAILGHDEPVADTELSAAVAGLTENPNGFGGFFSSWAAGVALAVGDIGVDPLAINFSVDVAGNVSLAGALAFETTDTPPACVEGAVYFDDSENWLCVCDGTSFKRADTGAACA